MLKFAIFLNCMLHFSHYATSQTNSPISMKRCSYDINKADNRADWKRSQYLTLKPGFFPWGVCLDSGISVSDAIDYTIAAIFVPLAPLALMARSSDHLSSRERKWIRKAMRIWNTEYKNHKYNTWGTQHVSRIPSGNLFIESCDRDKHNIIYIKKRDIGSPVAYYEPRDLWYDFIDFYGVIVLNSELSWTEAHFVNVMVHEFGHTLAIPHVPQGHSQIMIPAGFDCGNNWGKDKICDLTHPDFEGFLSPFDPPTRAENDRRIQQEIQRLNDCSSICACNPCSSRGVPL